MKVSDPERSSTICTLGWNICDVICRAGSNPSVVGSMFQHGCGVGVGVGVRVGVGVGVFVGVRVGVGDAAIARAGTSSPAITHAAIRCSRFVVVPSITASGLPP